MPHPVWASGPLLRSIERTPVARGVPRKTFSLCPECNREAVEAVVSGAAGIEDFRDRPGIVDAEILEEADRILMRKVCETHGPFEDLLSAHPAFFRRMENLAFGKDLDCAGDENVHGHGPNSIKSGRGTHLIIDLTNRCNMVCSPCFMDANAAAYVHELEMHDLRAILQRAVSFKPRREVNVVFSGGEATLSPIFLEAIRVAKEMGFQRIHVSTNGIRFAKEASFAFQARDAGLHAVYLQFDGVTNAQNQHRDIANYMEVKHRALENIVSAGMKATLQVTIINGVNNHALWNIVRFALGNPEKIHGLILQPIMFSGRDEDICNDERYLRRYPLSQVAYDLEQQSSIDWQPMRDWFPQSAYGVFAHLCDILNPDAELGSLFNDTHPDCGIFSPLLMDAETEHAVPLAAFFNLERFMRDVVEATDSGRGPAVTKALVLLSLLRNFSREQAPAEFGFEELRGVVEDCFYRIAGQSKGWSTQAYSYRGRWRLLIVNATWFQDLYNYDLSTICTSSVPVASQGGEISFSAYNGGRWRRVVERVYQTAALSDWHRSHPRHQIYAKGRPVELGQESSPNRLVQIEVEPAILSTNASVPHP